MPVTKKASEFVSKLSRKYVNSRKDEEALALAAKKVEMAKKSTTDVRSTSENARSINDRLAADSEIIRREKNKEKRKAGEPETKAPDYKDLKEDFNSGGMVTKSRSHPLNKFYGK
jgi:hypothetical protein